MSDNGTLVLVFVAVLVVVVLVNRRPTGRPGGLPYTPTTAQTPGAVWRPRDLFGNAAGWYTPGQPMLF